MKMLVMKQFLRKALSLYSLFQFSLKRLTYSERQRLSLRRLLVLSEILS